jgi:hypothetical protein
MRITEPKTEYAKALELFAIKTVRQNDMACPVDCLVITHVHKEMLTPISNVA